MNLEKSYRYCSGIQCFRTNILPLEKQIQRDGCQRSKASEAVGRRKPPIKERTCKKRIKPAQKRRIAEEIQQTYQLSERRACRLLDFDRSSK